MLEKIIKLLDSKVEENIDLVDNLITTKANDKNIVAIISILSMKGINTRDWDVVDIAKNLYPSHVNTNQYNDPKLLFQLALGSLRSEENLKYASEYYLQYINNIIKDANNIINNEKIIDETFEV